MKPSQKTEKMEQSLANFMGFDRRDSIHLDKCVPAPIGCGKPIDGFRDATSTKEYTISGLCQKCQDEIFGV